MAAEKALPPIISFERRAVENRTKSIAAAKKVYDDVDFVSIIPHGSAGKTRIDQVYSEWRARIQGEADTGDEFNPSRFPREWLDIVDRAYSAWKNGQEIVFEGQTPLAQWPAASPADVANCKSAEIHTVEQLALASETAIEHLGMGGRALVTRAKATVETSNSDTEKLASRLSAIEGDLAAQRAQNDDLREQLLAANTAKEAAEAATKAKVVPGSGTK